MPLSSIITISPGFNANPLGTDDLKAQASEETTTAPLAKLFPD